VVATSGAVLAVLLPADVRALWVLAAAAGLIGVQLLAGAWLALRLVGARTVGGDAEPAVRAALARLCQLADLPEPRLAIAATDEPIALAVRHPGGRSTICLGRGLLEALEPSEVEAVLAHELAHLAHRDAVVMTTAASLPALAGLMLRAYWWDGEPPGFGARMDREWHRLGMAREVAWSMLAGIPVLGMTVLRVVAFVPALALSAAAAVTLPAMAALSRARERAADHDGALLIGSPATLAAALLKIDAASAGIPTRDLRAVGVVNALLVHPIARGGFWDRAPLRSHPPTRSRVRALLELQRRLDAVPVPRD
jgi:heat shock protein HtpX